MGGYLALLRGVSSGGVELEMKTLREVLAYIGFSRVRTYLGSGNALFESADSNRRMMAAQIQAELKHRASVETLVMVLGYSELEAIAAEHPLADLGAEDKLYVTVLEYEPKREDRENLLATMNGTDTHHVEGRVVYSCYGEGYEKSRRTNDFIEKVLKVRATTRDWRTMRKLEALAREGSAPTGPDASIDASIGEDARSARTRRH